MCSNVTESVRPGASRARPPERLDRQARCVREEIVCRQEMIAAAAAARAAREDGAANAAPDGDPLAGQTARDFTAIPAHFGLPTSPLALAMPAGLVAGLTLIALGLEGVAEIVSDAAGAAVLAATSGAGWVIVRRHSR